MSLNLGRELGAWINPASPLAVARAEVKRVSKVSRIEDFLKTMAGKPQAYEDWKIETKRSSKYKIGPLLNALAYLDTLYYAQNPLTLAAEVSEPQPPSPKETKPKDIHEQIAEALSEAKNSLTGAAIEQPHAARAIRATQKLWSQLLAQTSSRQAGSQPFLEAEETIPIQDAYRGDPRGDGSSARKNILAEQIAASVKRTKESPTFKGGSFATTYITNEDGTLTAKVRLNLRLVELPKLTEIEKIKELPRTENKDLRQRQDKLITIADIIAEGPVNDAERNRIKRVLDNGAPFDRNANQIATGYVRFMTDIIANPQQLTARTEKALQFFEEGEVRERYKMIFQTLQGEAKGFTLPQ